MEYISLIIALIALVIAWQSYNKHKILKKDLSHLHNRLYSMSQIMQETDEKNQQELTTLRIELLKSQGDLKITGDMTLKQVSLIHPQAMQVLSGFHIGGCSSCAVTDDNERLDLTIARSGQQLEPVLIALNQLLAESKNNNGRVTEDRLKKSNVQLVF